MEDNKGKKKLRLKKISVTTLNADDLVKIKGASYDGCNSGIHDCRSYRIPPCQSQPNPIVD
ncbi:hypothetical protein [Aquimarina algiphila]|uniref:hypothetical protein n=1 Tax=Aquimarina algiphila TaxID=2047982 RepID=UPI0024904124|nr:hypothetical protein [Aquimarina algiphila]